MAIKVTFTDGSSESFDTAFNWRADADFFYLTNNRNEEIFLVKKSKVDEARKA